MVSAAQAPPTLPFLPSNLLLRNKLRSSFSAKVNEICPKSKI